MKAPRILNALRKAQTELPSGNHLEIWQGDKGFYIYYRYKEDDTLALLIGPYKFFTTVAAKAREIEHVLST